MVGFRDIWERKKLGDRRIQNSNWIENKLSVKNDYGERRDDCGERRDDCGDKGN